MFLSKYSCGVINLVFTFYLIKCTITPAKIYFNKNSFVCDFIKHIVKKTIMLTLTSFHSFSSAGV